MLRKAFGNSYRHKYGTIIPLYHPSYFGYRANKEKEEKQERILRYNIC